MEMDTKKRFIDALSHLFDPKLSSETSITTRESNIDQLLDDILNFQSFGNDLNKLTSEYPELGQLIKRLHEDNQVLSTEKLYHKLLKCIMWFYRKNPADELEEKVSDWAQNLIQNALRAGSRFSIYGPAESVIYPRPKSEDVIETFQTRLVEYIKGMNQSDFQIRRNWLSRCGLIVLKLSDPNRELLEVLVDVLPSSEKDFYETLSLNMEEITKGINIFSLNTIGGDLWSRRFFVKTARKYPTIMEDKIVEILSKWTDSWPDDIMDQFDSERRLIIECVSNDEKMFHILITILQLALMRLKYHSAVLDFIQWMMIGEKQKFFNLYPSHLRSLAYLMDITDISGLDSCFHCQCVLRILDELLEAIEKASIQRHEVQMLVSHFPNWWDYLKPIYLNDENVRIKVLLLLSFFSSQPFCKLVQDKTVL